MGIEENVGPLQTFVYKSLKISRGLPSIGAVILYLTSNRLVVVPIKRKDNFSANFKSIHYYRVSRFSYV